MPRSWHAEPEPEPGDQARPEDWAVHLRRGHPDAVRAVRARIARIISYRGLRIPPGDRSDLEQEISIEVWQAVNRSRFDVAGGFWGFVETVTARRCIDWLRRKERTALASDPISTADDPLERLIEQEREDLLSEVWARVGPECRTLISLRLREGLSFRELSERLEKTEGALRVQLYRCIRGARRILDGVIRERDPGEEALSSS